MTRILRATPSNTDDLACWQKVLAEKLIKLNQETFEKRASLTQFIQGLDSPKGEEAVKEATFAMQVAYNLGPDDAEAKARQVLQPGSPNFTGSRETCIMCWNFEDKSLWRGLSDNKKIVRLARSMVSSGFKPDEPIRSRTFDLSSGDGVLAGKLLFGDGQARGLAARLAWQFVLMFFRSNQHLIGEPEAMRVVQSLLCIPTVFEQVGKCSDEELMVAQAVRQNVKATMALPMNPVEWTSMILRTCNRTFGQPSMNKAEILACMRRCMTKYDSALEVDAFDIQPVAKRARKGRKKAASAFALGEDAKKPTEADEDRLRIGTKRMAAITNMLTHCSAKSFKQFEMHMVWVGDYNLSAVNDTTLALPWIWTGSLPDADTQPDEVSLIARDAAAKAKQGMDNPNVTVKPLKYDEVLTEEQHEQILQKAFNCFEEEALHLPDRHAWKSLVPSTDDWRTYRSVIQHWNQTIRQCCEVDLSKEDFQELEKAILFGDAMDSQIKGILKRFPKHFHIGMIPDMMTNFAANSSMDDATYRGTDGTGQVASQRHFVAGINRCNLYRCA